jgi:histidinol-phosphate aminotransferase
VITEGLSTRVRDCVNRMTAYVPGEQPGAGVVKLNTNENPYPPSPRVLEALRTFHPDGLRMYPNPSAARLRECIARLHGCAPEQVLVGNGSDEVLALCTRAFVEDDGAIGYFVPSYSLYPVLADIRGVARRPVPLGPTFEWCEPAAADALFFLTNPNAPTGLLFPRERVEAFCRTAAGVVVIDEAYVDFAEADCMDLALARENVLVTRTLSKSYGLAGLRVGYAVGPPALIEALAKIKDSYNLDAVSQCLAEAALADTAYLREVRARVIATRERLRTALAGMDFEVGPSATNFVWARPRRLAARAVFEQLRARRIFIRYFPGDVTGAYVRISVGTDDEIDRLLAALGELR